MTQEGTDRPDADNPSLSRPASGEVLVELENLRTGTGISTQGIRAFAPRLQELDVVSDQLEFQSFAPSDRHLAAYAAIGCVIEHAITDYQHQQILILSLRYDPSLLTLKVDTQAWNEVLRSPTVTHRDALTQALLFYKKSTYYEMRQTAYRELANQLTMRTRTPCRASGADQIAAEMLRFSLRQILGYFTIEGREVFREVLAEEATLQVSDNWKQTPDHHGSATDEFLAVVSRAIRDAYPAAVDELVQQSSEGARYGRSLCFSGDVLEQLLRPKHRGTIAAIFSGGDGRLPLHELLSDGSEPTWEQATRKLSDTLDVLSWVLVSGGADGVTDAQSDFGSLTLWDLDKPLVESGPPAAHTEWLEPILGDPTDDEDDEHGDDLEETEGG